MKNFEAGLRKEVFHYINTMMVENLRELQRQIEERFGELEEELFDKIPGEVIFKDDEDKNSDEESEDFKSEEDEKKKGPENYFIGDDFNVDEFVDDIFKEDEGKSRAGAPGAASSGGGRRNATESMSPKDLQRAYIL